jgi:hypothetical protein
MSVALVLERLLLDVLAEFQARDVEVRVLKGPAVAHLDYPRAEQREFGDVDLLVRPGDIDSATDTLRRLGLPEVSPAASTWKARQLRRGATFRTVDGAEVDLHWMLAPAPLGARVRPEDLWGSPETFRLGSDLVSALPRELRMLNAAYCAVRANPSHATLRDIAQLALHPELDAAQVMDLATSWRCRAVLAAALESTWRELRLADVTVLSAWAETFRPTDADRREIELYRQVAGAEAAFGSPRTRRVTLSPRLLRPFRRQW